MNELATTDAGSRAVARTSEASNVLQMVLDAARDPNVDAGKVETMANLAMRMQDREQEAEFNRDLNAAIMAMPTITKAGAIVINDKNGNYERTQGRYARYEDIDRVVRPILARHNLTIRFEVGEKDQTVTVRPILSHANGHTEKGEAMRLPLDSSGAKNNTQGAGSAVSYGKRYTMCAALNIVTEGTDDDGSLGKFSVDMPEERGNLVLDEAERASVESRYDEWFKTQGVKDRAFLITNGHHERFGGAPPMLTTPAPRAKPAGGAAAAPANPGPATSKHDLTTPAGYAANYVDLCKAAPSLAALSDVKRRADKALASLADKNPTRFAECEEAFDEARQRLTAGNDMFGGAK